MGGSDVIRARFERGVTAYAAFALSLSGIHEIVSSSPMPPRVSHSGHAATSSLSVGLEDVPLARWPGVTTLSLSPRGKRSAPPGGQKGCGAAWQRANTAPRQQVREGGQVKAMGGAESTGK